MFFATNQRRPLFDTAACEFCDNIRHNYLNSMLLFFRYPIRSYLLLYQSIAELLVPPHPPHPISSGLISACQAVLRVIHVGETVRASQEDDEGHSRNAACFQHTVIFYITEIHKWQAAENWGRSGATTIKGCLQPVIFIAILLRHLFQGYWSNQWNAGCHCSIWAYACIWHILPSDFGGLQVRIIEI